MTLPLRRKRRITPRSTTAITLSRRLLAGALCAAMLTSGPLSQADHVPRSAANSNWKEPATLRPVQQSQPTRLRWQSPSDDDNKTVARISSEEPRAVASTPAAGVKKRTTRSRLEEHARREAAHVTQTSGTKPKEDPFADPFFNESSSGPRLAAQPKRPEPLLSQPVRLQQPSLFDDDLLDAQPDLQTPEVDTDFFPLQPTPDDDMQFDPEEPLPVPDDDIDDFRAQAFESGELPPCPSPADVKQIREITTDISAQAGEFPPECPLGDMAYSPRMFMPITYTWKASALCYKPLYFQQAAVERYGHSWGPLLQPILSGADFYARVFALPYMIGMDPPTECVYALGWYRPGSCAPQMIYPIPISLRGALLEAGVILGAVALIP